MGLGGTVTSRGRRPNIARSSSLLSASTLLHFLTEPQSEKAKERERDEEEDEEEEAEGDDGEGTGGGKTRIYKLGRSVRGDGGS